MSALNDQSIRVLEAAGAWLIQWGCELTDRAWHMRQRRGTTEDQLKIAKFWAAYDRAMARIQADIDIDAEPR